ncbi:MAG: hypothetical protein Q8L29_01655 [archaeon]|nr:hypothetical protein [archaeon]
MKQEVLGLVRERAIESTAGSLSGAVAKLMLANALMQVMHIEREITKKKHRNKQRRAK